MPVKVNDNGFLLDTIMVAGPVGSKASSSGEVGLDTLQPVAGWWIFESRSHEELDVLAKADAELWKKIYEDLAKESDESDSSEL